MDAQQATNRFSSPPLLIALVELLIASALVIGANIYDIVPISETPWLIGIGCLSLRLRKLSWQTLGLRRPENWRKTILLALLIAIAWQLVSEFITEPLITRLTGHPTDLSSFQDLVGNLPNTLIMLALIWTFAAFGEELSYRGYVLERAAALGKWSSTSYLVAMIAVSVLFGIGHYYKGIAGIVDSTLSGLLFGSLYLLSGRNLWLPILAHGFSDTMGLLLIYFGLVKMN